MTRGPLPPQSRHADLPRTPARLPVHQLNEHIGAWAERSDRAQRRVRLPQLPSALLFQCAGAADAASHRKAQLRARIDHRTQINSRSAGQGYELKRIGLAGWRHTHATNSGWNHPAPTYLTFAPLRIKA